MIQNYVFLMMVTIQVLVGSLLNPALLIRRVGAPVTRFPFERFAELFPGVERDRSAERFAIRYRALNGAIAVLGLLLAGWMFTHVQDSNWTEQHLAGLMTAYLIVQVAPLALLGIQAARYGRLLKTSADGKRKAVLQRRGLFDFVSPSIVCLAVLSYGVLVALVLYLRQHPFPGFGGFTNVAIVTLMWAFFSILVYATLYGRNRGPRVTYAVRLRAIGSLVRTFVFTCIGVTVFTSLILTLGLLHLRSWDLVAVSGFFVICISLTTLGLRRQKSPTTTHTEIVLPGADLDKFAGRYDLGNGFRVALASDGSTLWWLRLGIQGAQPVPLFPEAPLAFFWKDIDQQIRFITDPGGAVTGAEITNEGHAMTARRGGRESSAPLSHPGELGPRTA